MGGDSVIDSGPSKRNRNSAILFNKLLNRNSNDVAYGIGAIKCNVKNDADLFRHYVENNKITPSTRLDILLRNRK